MKSLLYSASIKRHENDLPNVIKKNQNFTFKVSLHSSFTEFNLFAVLFQTSSFVLESFIMRFIYQFDFVSYLTIILIQFCYFYCLLFTLVRPQIIVSQYIKKGIKHRGRSQLVQKPDFKGEGVH